MSTTTEQGSTVHAAHGKARVWADPAGTLHVRYDGMLVTLARGQYDQVRLVTVDTSGLPEDADGPQVRLYLNDEVQYENPRFVAPEE